MSTMDINGQPVVSGTELDFTGKSRIYRINIRLKDQVGNECVASITFRIITSITSISKLIDRYMLTGDFKEPLSTQLKNRLNQVEHHLSLGNKKQAVKHMEDFRKHLGNSAMHKNISEPVKDILDADAVYVIGSLTE